MKKNGRHGEPKEKTWSMATGGRSWFGCGGGGKGDRERNGTEETLKKMQAGTSVRGETAYRSKKQS